MSISTITSSVSDISSRLYGAASTITQDYQERTETLDRVFSNLDTDGKGYLDASDFETAFAALGLDESGEKSDGNLTLPGVEDVVAALDMDGDGKVSSDDLTEGMRSLTDSLSFLQGRAETWGSEALGGMPPPPSTDQAAGFTQEELTSQMETLTAAGATEDDGAVLLSSILSQFNTADADDDGRVSGAEAMSFGQTLRSSTTQDDSETQATEDTTASTSGTTGSTASSELLVMRRIMQLMSAYGSSYHSNGSSSESLSLVA
jgi:hypothetical protein